MAEIGKELLAAKGKSLVVCGLNDSNAQLVTNAINNLLLASRKDLDTLYAMFKPFLDNLSSDPSKDVIQWDGKKRVEQISQFKMKVEKFIENSKRRGV